MFTAMDVIPFPFVFFGVCGVTSVFEGFYSFEISVSVSVLAFVLGLSSKSAPQRACFTLIPVPENCGPMPNGAKG
jgi:hypothetical protein